MVLWFILYRKLNGQSFWPILRDVGPDGLKYRLEIILTQRARIHLGCL